MILIAGPEALVEPAGREGGRLIDGVVGLQAVHTARGGLHDQRVVGGFLRADPHEVPTAVGGGQRAGDHPTRTPALETRALVGVAEPNEGEVEVFRPRKERDLHHRAFDRMEDEPILVARADGAAGHRAERERPRALRPLIGLEGVVHAVRGDAAPLLADLAGRAAAAFAAIGSGHAAPGLAEGALAAITVPGALHAASRQAYPAGTIHVRAAVQRVHAGPSSADAPRTLGVGPAGHAGPVLANEAPGAARVRRAGVEGLADAVAALLPGTAVQVRAAGRAFAVDAEGNAGIAAVARVHAGVGGNAAAVFANRAQGAIHQPLAVRRLTGGAPDADLPHAAALVAGADHAGVLFTVGPLARAIRGRIAFAGPAAAVAAGTALESRAIRVVFTEIRQAAPLVRAGLSLSTVEIRRAGHAGPLHAERRAGVLAVPVLFAGGRGRLTSPLLAAMAVLAVLVAQADQAGRSRFVAKRCIRSAVVIRRADAARALPRIADSTLRAMCVREACDASSRGPVAKFPHGIEEAVMI